MKKQINEAANLEYKKYALHIGKDKDGEQMLVLYNFQVLMKGILLSYLERAKAKTNKVILTKYDIIVPALRQAVRGMVRFNKYNKDFYEIKNSAAIGKTGPMLYDAALVYVSSKNANIICDRSSVSNAALRVYDAWMDNGRGATGIKIEYTDENVPKHEWEAFKTGEKLPEVIQVGFYTPSEPAWYARLRANDEKFTNTAYKTFVAAHKKLNQKEHFHMDKDLYKRLSQYTEALIDAFNYNGFDLFGRVYSTDLSKE